MRPLLPMGSLFLPPLILSIALYLALSAEFSLTRLLNSQSPISNFLLGGHVVVQDNENNITYIGTAKGNVEQFLNIFYAQDTGGASRFTLPVPLKPEAESTVDATQLGAWCPQQINNHSGPLTTRNTNISENCLSLSITRPTLIKKDVKLPVLVYVHGGKLLLKWFSQHGVLTDVRWTHVWVTCGSTISSRKTRDAVFS